MEKNKFIYFPLTWQNILEEESPNVENPTEASSGQEKVKQKYRECRVLQSELQQRSSKILEELSTKGLS